MKMFVFLPLKFTLVPRGTRTAAGERPVVQQVFLLF